MNFGSELRGTDCIGLPRFTPQQAKAIINRVKKTGALVSEPPPCEGQGIVIAGGGRYLDWGYVLVRKLRAMGCQLPIQMWHLGPKEMPGKCSDLFKQMDCETVDAHRVMMNHPVREMSAWVMKSYAVRHCPWRQVMFLDADCFPEILPEEIFNDKDVRSVGSLFFHDVGHHNSGFGYLDWSLLPLEREFETGQFLFDKHKAWLALCWILWASEHASDVFYQTGHGDKFVHEVSIRSSGVPHLIGGPSNWEGYGIGHQFKGRLAFKHAMAMKRREWPMFPELAPAFEEFKTFKF